jgi:hypothetical protein
MKIRTLFLIWTMGQTAACTVLLLARCLQTKGRLDEEKSLEQALAVLEAEGGIVTT